jgi:hypothetical protein
VQVVGAGEQKVLGTATEHNDRHELDHVLEKSEETIRSGKESIMGRHMHPQIRKGLSLGVSFQFFEYLSFEFWVWVWVFCETLANFEKDNLKYRNHLRDSARW